ncbi:RNA polymerase sigma factor [Dyadobacter luticola]|uniref:RNA polymerase sigma factor n=1 Tax=Dyadobacter luticola TaxID=1979387 RepID=A0A5R9KPD5_9BACT|nr:RNA polymerase sigma factor [Dyadobacter luticola]TLU98082.1 RNA polymerase sigma factor [Dyadobacter luticola]
MTDQTAHTFIVSHTASDEELVRLFIETGDNRHFEKLYERYAYKVYKKCRTLTGDSSKAEDITQDVFLKLMFKMNTFKKGAKFSTWLFTITHNHCRDLVRISKRRVVLVNEAGADLVDESDLHNIFGTDEIDTGKFKIAITQLSLEEKAIIYLKYLENKTIRDIADIFDTTESAVKMRLMRSREKLRKQYLHMILFG